jgi:hypothetical protein
MSEIRIRFNKDHKGANDAWRVFENGREHIVAGFVVEGMMQSDSTLERGEQKWNVLCEGELRIHENRAYIRTCPAAATL